MISCSFVGLVAKTVFIVVIDLLLPCSSVDSVAKKILQGRLTLNLRASNPVRYRNGLAIAIEEKLQIAMWRYLRTL